MDAATSRYWEQSNLGERKHPSRIWEGNTGIRRATLENASFRLFAPHTEDDSTPRHTRSEWQAASSKPDGAATSTERQEWRTQKLTSRKQDEGKRGNKTRLRVEHSLPDVASANGLARAALLLVPGFRNKKEVTWSEIPLKAIGKKEGQ